MEVYVLFLHIYLRAAASVAGEQNPPTKAGELERKVSPVGCNGVVLFYLFPSSLPGCGTPGAVGTVTLTRFDAFF